MQRSLSTRRLRRLAACEVKGRENLLPEEQAVATLARIAAGGVKQRCFALPYVALPNP